MRARTFNEAATTRFRVAPEADQLFERPGCTVWLRGAEPRSPWAAGAERRPRARRPVGARTVAAHWRWLRPGAVAHALRRCLGPPTRWPVDHAEERADRHRHAELEPGAEVIPASLHLLEGTRPLVTVLAGGRRSRSEGAAVTAERPAREPGSGWPTRVSCAVASRGRRPRGHGRGLDHEPSTPVEGAERLRGGPPPVGAVGPRNASSSA